MSLPAERVRAASAAWVWFPATATLHETTSALLVHFPSWFEHTLELTRFDPAGDLDAETDAVLAAARATGEPELVWWVKLGAAPGVEDVVRARGGVLDETLDVLACDLSRERPRLEAPDLEVRRAVDPATMRDSRVVMCAAFGGSLPPDVEIEADAALGAESWARGDGGGVVAYLDGVPVGTGGLTVADGVGRLWSGSVVEAARHRGVYRALLDVRLRFAREHGATMALVKGRVATSGPILRRAGFEAFGQERSYLVPL